MVNMLEDVEISSESDCEENESENKHRKMLSDLDESLGNQKKRQFSSTRTEPSNEISEYNWSSNSDKVTLHDLVGSLDSKCKSVAKVKKKLQKMENKTKVLEKPLEKVQKERVERSVAYEETVKDITKWNATIQKNRGSEQLVFPLGSYKPVAVSTKNMVLQFKPQNEMEKQISAVLHGSKHLLERKDKELTEAEEKVLQTVDLEEALERRKELQKTRALQSYYEVKCHRIKKIKSKKYHRMMKKQQQKALSKIDLETLSKENPELFASEMEKVEKLRAKERANLRHCNTSKWAKNLITRGHKCKEDQERVREQLRIGRQLTEHQNVEQSDDADEAGEKDIGEITELSLLKRTDDEDNPWLLGNSICQENDTSLDPQKQYTKLEAITVNCSETPMQETTGTQEDNISSADEWEKAGKECSPVKKKKGDKGKRKKKVCVKKSSGEENNGSKKGGSLLTSANEKESSFEEVADKPAEKLKRICNSAKLHSQSKDNKLTSTLTQQKQSSDCSKLYEEDINVIAMCEEGESTDDEGFTLDNTEQARNISEAFANDDVVAEFLQEKHDIIESSKPKPVDLTLPGWGDWAGPGLTVSKKKRKRFTKDLGGGRKRKDDSIANLIVNEKCNEKFAHHQLSALPFPYTNNVEFERSIRQPIGPHWNTPSIHNKLIEPKVRITPGTTIDPLKASRRMKKKFIKENI